MKFMILAFETPADFAARSSPALQAQYWAGWAAFGAALKAAGVVSGMHGLKGIETASSVRVRNGEKEVARGPFSAGGDAELGGYFVVEVDNEEAAIEWAARCPAAVNGTVEVRPVL